jgi:hexosaminidase
LGETFGPMPGAPPPTPAPNVRASQDLKLCTNAIALNLEDDAPVRGERAKFLVDIMNPCWIWPAAPLDGVTALEVSVGQLPFNFQIGDDVKKIHFRPPATPAGELEVRDGCKGPLLASLPLAPALASQGVTRLRAPLAAAAGPHDLCFSFTQAKVEPLWVLDSVRLEAPGGR